MKQLSLFLFFVTICQNFETVKIHFDPKLVLFVCCFFFFKSKMIIVNF